VKVTPYFEAIVIARTAPSSRTKWIERAIQSPLRELVQADGRIRRWALVPEMESRYLRVILLPDGETVHNAFFDRRFMP
jgi:hypothetical protein